MRDDTTKKSHQPILPRLHAQASRLYVSPGAQRLALLHHSQIMRAHAPTVHRLLLWDSLGRAIEEGTP